MPPSQSECVWVQAWGWCGMLLCRSEDILGLTPTSYFVRGRVSLAQCASLAGLWASSCSVSFSHLPMGHAGITDVYDVSGSYVGSRDLNWVVRFAQQHLSHWAFSLTLFSLSQTSPCLLSVSPEKDCFSNPSKHVTSVRPSWAVCQICGWHKSQCKYGFVHALMHTAFICDHSWYSDRLWSKAAHCEVSVTIWERFGTGFMEVVFWSSPVRGSLADKHSVCKLEKKKRSD